MTFCVGGMAGGKAGGLITRDVYRAETEVMVLPGAHPQSLRQAEGVGHIPWCGLTIYNPPPIYYSILGYNSWSVSSAYKTLKIDLNYCFISHQLGVC